MHVEVISIGRELLRGDVADANARVLADAFTRRGALVRRITVVDDLEAEIAAAVGEALRRNPHVVATAGGLGPGPGDRTMAGVAQALGLPLTVNRQARSMIEAAYLRRQASGSARSAGMTLSREKMCRLPVGATALTNPPGIAPGMLYRLPGGAVVLCLPGSRKELAAVLEQALPLLGELVSRPRMARRRIESPTADEASLRPILDRLAAEYAGLWVASSPGDRVVVTLEVSAATREEAESTVDRALRRLLALAGGGA